MANTPLTIRIPLEADLLIRLKGTDTLHLVGTVTYEPDVDIVLTDAVRYDRNN
jgi:hypothetical protein